MRNADADDKYNLTEPLNGVGFAELWLALEWNVGKGVRSLHLLPIHRVKEHQQGEIDDQVDRWDKKLTCLMAQRKDGGEWKIHRESAEPMRTR